MPASDEQHFVEAVSRYFEQMGLPRLAGRVLGVLLISDPPAQSLSDLCARLNASKGAVSATTRMLAEMNLIERAASSVPRQVCYRFRPGGWSLFMVQRARLWASMHEIAEDGLGLLKDKDTALRERLQEVYDMFSAEDLREFFGRAETRREAAEKARK